MSNEIEHEDRKPFFIPTSEMVEHLMESDAGIDRTCAKRLAELEQAVLGLKLGDCWCDMATGNPMMTRHSQACVKAQELTKNAS